MAHISEVSLVILPGSEQGLAQAEVSFEANFTKQELAQKSPYTLAIGLFAVYDDTELPEPLAGLMGNESHPMRLQPHYRPSGGRPGWRSDQNQGVGGSPRGWQGPPASGYGAESAPYPYDPSGRGYSNPGAYNYAGPHHAEVGFGMYGMQPQGAYGPASSGGYGPGAQHYGQPGASYGRPAGNQGGYGTHGPQQRGYPQGYAAPGQRPYHQRTEGGYEGRESTEARAQTERFLFWVCREVMTPNTAPQGVQRRVLFDPYTFLNDTSLLRTYVWLVPERTEGRGWSNLAQIPRAA